MTENAGAMSPTGVDGSAPNAIEVRNLYKRFGRQTVLKGVNLDCPHGAITTIVGPSGCGKTVTLRHLNLLMHPDSGRIVIDGVDVSRMRGRALDPVREKFGMLFQGNALFDSMTVFENVAFPLIEKTRLAEAQIEAAVHETLVAVGLEGMEKKYPSEMSGGMQKRAALARALIRKPKILMLDEPTTGLDPSRTGAIHDLIRRAQRKFGVSAVLVSHDVPKVFEISDRLAFMHEGKIRLYGTVEQVTGAKDEVFAHFLAGKSGYDSEDAMAQRA
jgi:phospholipid/cholesterol/gamma-HCH transport system ATP-binding protein